MLFPSPPPFDLPPRRVGPPVARPLSRHSGGRRTAGARWAGARCGSSERGGPGQVGEQKNNTPGFHPFWGDQTTKG